MKIMTWTSLKRRAAAAILTASALALVPGAAWADGTAFLGFSPTPETRATKGFSLGVSLIVVGFEFEYASTGENLAKGAPGLKTGMINGLVQTPTRMQFYLTGGGGFFRERLADEGETNFGTNIGGGIKMPLVGPLRLRLDYRVFNLRGGDTLYPHPQRFYAGLNVAF
jgi:hypothetical protein